MYKYIMDKIVAVYISHRGTKTRRKRRSRRDRPTSVPTCSVPTCLCMKSQFTIFMIQCLLFYHITPLCRNKNHVCKQQTLSHGVGGKPLANKKLFVIVGITRLNFQ